MFENYLESIANLDSKYQLYAKDVTKHIEYSIDKGLELYATHSHCTDGGVAGSMIKYAKPNSAIVPLDYWMINDEIAANILSQINWQGIVDLKPFNKTKIGFWVDHHVSAMSIPPNANKIRFDAYGDSGAYQLLLSNFLGGLPRHLVELAVMTRTTDTAGYKTEPPIDKFDDLKELKVPEFYDPESILDNEQRIWLLDDAWNTAHSLKDHFELHKELSRYGFLGINKFLPKINELRGNRQKAYETADQIAPNDIVAFSFKSETQDKFTILRRLQTNGVKVAISLSIQNNGGVKISFRRNRELNSLDTNKLKVNEVASKLNGGGHEGASGAYANNLDDALNIINEWSKKLNYNFEHVSI